MRSLLVIVACLLMAGCADPGEPGTYQHEERETTVYLTYRLGRVVDKEAGVVCYTYVGYGLDCLPLSQTTLKVQ